MSSHRELPSLLTPSDQDEPLIHTVNIAPLSLLLESMDPEPTANPHAELVIECFEECPALPTLAWDWSPITPPDLILAKGPGCRDVGEPAVDKGEVYIQDGKVVDFLIDEGWEESNMPLSSWVGLLGLAGLGHGGDPIGQEMRTIVVEDRIKWELDGACTLPGLKELGLDIYVEKRL